MVPPCYEKIVDGCGFLARRRFSFHLFSDLDENRGKRVVPPEDLFFCDRHKIRTKVTALGPITFLFEIGATKAAEKLRFPAAFSQKHQDFRRFCGTNAEGEELERALNAIILRHNVMSFLEPLNVSLGF